MNPVALKYTVTGLNAFTPIDPFELINFSCKYSNGTYELGQTASSRYISPIGIATEFDGIIVDVEEGKGYCNGDIVHVSLTEEYLASIVEKYGENFFSRTEADITLNHLPELPNTKEKAKELIDSLDEICLENVNYKMKSLVDRQFECETSVEQIGTMLYYNEETHGEASGNNSFNQIVFVFKLENNENPNGWYSYLAYNNDMMIRWMLNKETATIEKGTADIYGYHLEDMDFNNTFYQSGFEHSFEYNSQSYPGCRTLDETIQAISATVTGARNCNHLVVDGALESIVSEY